ncbi:MAG TPA: right-handed parallel beta-helix repeat-containing protein, partial [Ignavibacteriaceae bacterium]
ALYTEWEAEGTPPEDGLVTLYNDSLPRDIINGAVVTDSNTQHGTLIYGPMYRQEKHYAVVQAGVTIDYIAKYFLKLEDVDPWIDSSPEDTICIIQVTTTRTWDDHNGWGFHDIYVIKDSVITYGDFNNINQWQEFDIEYDHMNVPPEFSKAGEIPYYIMQKPTTQGIGRNVDRESVHCVEFKIKWKGNPNVVRLSVDKIIVSDPRGRLIMHDAITQGLIVEQLNENRSDFGENRIAGWIGLDEPWNLDYWASIRKVSEIIDANSTKAKLWFQFNVSWNGRFGDAGDPARGSQAVMIDEFMRRVKKGNVWITHWLYDLPCADTSTFFLCQGVDYRLINIDFADSLYRKAAIASNMHPGLHFGISVQTGRYEYENYGGMYQIREISGRELLYQTNLALIYGSKLISPWLYFGGFNPPGGPVVTGLRNFQNFEITDKYNALKDTIAPRLSGLMGKTLRKLKPQEQYAGSNGINYNPIIQYENLPGGYRYIEDIHPPIPPSNDEYGIDMGFFEDPNDTYKKYFMVLNRYYSQIDKYIIKLQDLLGFSNWNLFNYVDPSSVTLITSNNKSSFLDTLLRGDAKLYSVGPVVKYGGTLIEDETAGDGMILNGDMIIDNGAVLSVFENYYAKGNIIINNGTIENMEGGKIIFQDGKKLIIRSNAIINGTANDKLTFDFVNPDSSNGGNGIVIEPGGSLNISYCKVQNAENGIKSEVNAENLSVQNVDFTDCESYSVIILGQQGESESTPPPPQIKYCTIYNSEYGISVSNLSQVIIRENQIDNTGWGINLYNVSTPFVMGNVITGGTPQYPGIFLTSTGGFISSNTISGHTNGIHLDNSSPDIGGNILEDNLNRGLYVGEGSLPNLEGSLAQDPEHSNLFYAVSGYNKIRNNGGWSVEDDGSEIFLYNSNVILSYGCNEITDQRIPDEEDTPPLYNTQLLITSDGNEGVIEVFAEKNFWDEHPIYHLEERFGENLIVYFEPSLAEPCPQPDGSEGEMYITSSTGEVIDTLFAEEITAGTLTATELLYASAETKFITADFNGAETIYNQIVNGNDSIQVKLKAYKRLYETGKL